MSFAQLATATLALHSPHSPNLLKITADKSATAIGEKLVPDAIKNLWQTVTGKLQYTDDSKKAIAKAAERLKLPLQNALAEGLSFVQSIRRLVPSNKQGQYIATATGTGIYINQGTGNSITVNKP